MQPHPGPGQAAVAGMGYVRYHVDSEWVCVTAARPTIIENTAEATFKLQICVRHRGALAIAADDLRNIGQYCGRIFPAKGASMRARGSAPDQIIVTVTVHRPGTVHLQGAHLTYSHGCHHGSQDTGIGLLLRVAQSLHPELNTGANR